MSWCPKCGLEYRDGFDTCNDCEEKLVEYLEPVQEEIPNDNETYLNTVNNEIEANVIESLLRSYDIPVRRSYKEAGGYMNIYMGMTNTGIDLYVPESREAEAREILSSSPDIQSNEQSIEVEDINEEISFQDKRRSRTQIMLLILLLPTILTLIMYFVYRFKDIYR